MWLRRLAMGLMLCLVLFSSLQAVERPSRFVNPEDVVAWLYRDYGWECFIDKRFSDDLLIDQSRSVLEQYFEPALAALIAKDRAFEKKTGHLGHLDFSLLFGSQDTDGICCLSIVRLSGTSDVRVTYNQGADKNTPTITFKMVSSSKTWRISDVHYQRSAQSNFISLVHLLAVPNE